MLKNGTEPEVATQAFSPSAREAEAGGFVNARPAWSTRAVPGQAPKLERNLSQKQKIKQTTEQSKTLTES